MADLLRILFLVPLAFIAAVLAATLTILAGWYGHQAGAISSDIVATGYVIGEGVMVMVRVGALAFIPAVLVAVLAELFRWRSVYLYLAVGGALGLLASQFPLMGWAADGQGRQLLLAAAGFVGGFVYWLIAGRLSGFARASAPPAPPLERPATPPTSPE